MIFGLIRMRNEGKRGRERKGGTKIWKAGGEGMESWRGRDEREKGVMKGRRDVWRGKREPGSMREVVKN